jgi:ABC-type Na+ transport system ATPase subunit NatA/ABC-type transport system involved in multi-copper enzyme maturation permease subunit
MPVIEVRGLTKRFGPMLAVDQMSFDVEPGTVVGFLGSNGAGKTTTLRMLLGMVRPDAGTATINGRAYPDLQEPLHQVGAVLEASSFHPGRTARNHLRIQAMAGQADPSRIDDVLDLVELTGVAGRRIGGFSLGMRQRLGLATALLTDPDLLILDEPASGLDPEGVRWLRDLLRGLAAEGATVLVSSHILAEVAQTVDSVVIRLIRVELLKLRTTRLTYGLLATAAALTAVFAVIEAARAGSGHGVGSLSTASGLDAVITAGIWALVLATVMGVTVSSGEFRHATATLTYLAAPQRGRVLTAKAVAGACAGAVFGLAGYVIALAVGLSFVAARGYHVAIGDATLARYALGHIVGTALLAAIGVGVGSLIRSQLAGVIGVFAWTIVIESILGGLFTSIRPYLPYTAASTLSGTPLGGSAFGPAHGLAGGAPLPFAAATALLAGLAIVFCAVAARTTVVRDVT